ncbi:ADL123Cp [Eremothecium gossypii ATCC 10895]|uniref:ADL123Cp n=1 Tax=Eremothecium gossypii (strain ATCC 10895 / CBS 109.51 / FGSC 9923 / NRRL Y-1056) TaxID=284811 RepID=Q75AP3_EREGS|nr:ADL123Cp [Eremothecium gossypii ATCC 10895]AAS51797.3 ADL123Cp [Eremothecium gossypii ATCC 10895]
MRTTGWNDTAGGEGRTILEQVGEYLSEQGRRPGGSTAGEWDEAEQTEHERERRDKGDQMAGPGSHFLDFSLLDEGNEVGDKERLRQRAAVFSPVMSPMLHIYGSVSNTPLLTADKAHASQNTPHLQGAGAGSALQGQGMSPLSSPALGAGAATAPAAFSLPEAAAGIVSRKCAAGSARPAKKTPHSTPYLGATPGKVVKQSPLVDAKKSNGSTVSSGSSSKYKNHTWDDMFCLPTSSMGIGGHSSLGSTPDDSLRAPLDGSDDLHDARKPAPGLPRFILPSNNPQRQLPPPPSDSVIHASQSPVIKPNYAGKPPGFVSARSVRTLSGGDANTGDEFIKKEVHKVAEQGRRNRLNNALAELNDLLPPELKESAQVPSKATTVELACKYIRQLTGQQN